MYYYEPRITLLAKPTFTAPEHLDVAWIGESTAGEQLAEFAGRLCYMSQKNPAGRTTRAYLENIKKQGHGSVLEHASYSLLFEGVSRSLTHELVRHRAGFAYSQLSQRYVDEKDASFVVPPAVAGDEALEGAWRSQVDGALASYIGLVEQLMERYSWVADKVHRRKMAREAARGVLPNSTETKIVVTANARARARSWRFGGWRWRRCGCSRRRRRDSFRTSRSTSATIGERRRESDFTKCEIKSAHKQKIIALHFIDS